LRNEPRHEFDRRYLDRLAAGDPEIESHFNRYFRELLVIKLRSRLRSSALVDDAIQETFLRVLRAVRQPGGIQSPGGFGSFVNSVCNNDLPKWYKPSSGATSTASTSPGVGWFLFPYTRTYTVEQFQGDLTSRVLSPATYGVKLLTVTVRPTSGPFPGLRQTTQSVYVRFRDASPN